MPILSYLVFILAMSAIPCRTNGTRSTLPWSIRVGGAFHSRKTRVWQKTKVWWQTIFKSHCALSMLLWALSITSTDLVIKVHLDFCLRSPVNDTLSCLYEVEENIEWFQRASSLQKSTLPSWIRRFNAFTRHRMTAWGFFFFNEFLSVIIQKNNDTRNHLGKGKRRTFLSPLVKKWCWKNNGKLLKLKDLNPFRSGDSSMMAAEVDAVETKLPTFTSSTATVLKLILFFITSFLLRHDSTL